MPIHALLWDLGGVIVRTEDWAPREALAARLGLTRQQLNTAVFGPPEGPNPVQLGELTVAEYHAGIAAALGVPLEEVPAALAEFYGGDVTDPLLVEELRRLRGAYRLVLVSNHTPDLRQRLQGGPLEDLFHRLVISAEVGLAKPDPAIFELALEQAGCLPEESVFIDDHEPNVAAARALGLHGIVFTSPGQALADLHDLLEDKTM